MSLISILFPVFLAVLFAGYFLLPLRFRWLWLLAGSIVFYCWGCPEQLLFPLVAWMIAYCAALLIEKISEKKKKRPRLILFLGVLPILALMVLTRAGERILSSVSMILRGRPLSLSILVPLGISYYTFALVGYLADVYWKKNPAERNPLKLLLYVLFFPHITQGPIPRFRKLAPQLMEGHPFDYGRFCFGLQRIIWGYFKKLVVADRFSVIVRTVFENAEKYKGLTFVAAASASAVQLYADFSGCMDIALGVSEALGITLDENFRRPFFAKSAAEFWRRWHITLGAWFKDYVYMPLVVSPVLVKLSGASRKVFGKRFARSLMTVIPLAVVWFLTGSWHGTGWNYIAWGIWWGGIIILSSVFAPELKKLTHLLRIPEDSFYWDLFRMVRTFVIFCVGRLLTAPGSLSRSLMIAKRILLSWNPWVFFDGTLYQLGLDAADFWVGILSLLFLWYISVQQEKGIRIREKIASYPVVIRWGIYYGAVFAVLVFGMYGSGHTSNGFIYAQY